MSSYLSRAHRCRLKGKAEPLPVFAVTGERQKRAIRLQEPTYALPMVGRRQELQIINDRLDLALQGKGQVIGIVADAGMGKSRLVAEVIRSARQKGLRRLWRSLPVGCDPHAVSGLEVHLVGVL